MEAVYIGMTAEIIHPWIIINIINEGAKHSNVIVGLLICKANKVTVASNAVLYQPRTSPPETAVICHLADMFTNANRIGVIYNCLELD